MIFYEKKCSLEVYAKLYFFLFCSQNKRSNNTCMMYPMPYKLVVLVTAVTPSKQKYLQINVFLSFNINKVEANPWDCHGRDRMVVEFTTAYAISAYHH